MTEQVCERKEAGIPKLILGAANIGHSIHYNDSLKMIKEFEQSGHNEIDTAYMYGMGKSEKLIGKININHKNLKHKLKISTKANPNFISYRNSKIGLYVQLNVSLDRMNIKKCDIFYLHFPQWNLDIYKTLKTVNQLYLEGKFNRFGLSNFAAWQVAEIWYICNQNNFIKPSIYQGMYNALTRDVENELMPCLRRFGIKFYAFNIIAGGILSGKHKYEHLQTNNIQNGRFSNNQVFGAMYRKRYWQQSTFDAVNIIQTALNNVYGGKVGILEASLRWTMLHSSLGKGDGIIIGCSNYKQFKQNFSALQNAEPLDEKVLKAFDVAWEIRKGDCPSYVGDHVNPGYCPPVSKL